MKRSRYNNTFLLNLYNLRPLTLLVEHELVPSGNYYLHTFFEYMILNSISTNGEITRLNNY